MPLLTINHKHIHSAFFLNSFFCSILFAILFVFNDILSDQFSKYKISNHRKYQLRLLFHFLAILILSFILTHLFRLIFGWGDLFLGESL